MSSGKSVPPPKPWERGRSSSAGSSSTLIPGTAVSGPKPWERPAGTTDFAAEASTSAALANRSQPSRPWEAGADGSTGTSDGWLSSSAVTPYGGSSSMYNRGGLGTSSVGMYGGGNTYGGGLGGYGSRLGAGSSMYGGAGGYGSSMYGGAGGYGSSMYGGSSSMYGSGGMYGAGSSMYGGGGGYGSSMYGAGGGYGSSMYGAGGGMYGAGGGMYGAGGMGAMGMPPGGVDPNGMGGRPPGPPNAWAAFLGIINGAMHFFGRLSFLVDENTHAVHFFISALLQLLDRAGSLYAEIARFVLRLLFRRHRMKKMASAGALAIVPAGGQAQQSAVGGPDQAQAGYGGPGHSQMQMQVHGGNMGMGGMQGMAQRGQARGGLPIGGGGGGGQWDSLWGAGSNS